MAAPTLVLSFDIEEHHRIEAAVGVNVDPTTQQTYAARMEDSTRRLMDQLAARGAKATFYVVGEIALSHPKLLRDIHDAGHEVGSHSHAHHRIHRMNPASLRQDLSDSKTALEQATGAPVFGFRAPTFSVTRETAWAIDVIADVGFRYDSSVFPVRHDRYGVHDAPRWPFVIRGHEREMLELPPATLKSSGQNLPVAGGGYFRLFPPFLMRAGIRQLHRNPLTPTAMLYFHPWEFDPDQPRLPLGRLSRFRTYVGVGRTTARLDAILKRYSFARAIDVVQHLETVREQLPRFDLGGGRNPRPAVLESPQLANVRE